MPRRVTELEAAGDAALSWTSDHKLIWDGVPVARLRPGSSLLRPQVEVLDSEFLDGPQRERVRLRLVRWVSGVVMRDLAPLFAAEAAALQDTTLRGPLHRIVEAAGVVPGGTEHDVAPALRGRLKALGLRAGRFALFLPAALKPRAQAARAALWAVRARIPTPVLPAPGLVSLLPPPEWPPGFAAAMGWLSAGPVLLRLDVAERVAAELAYATRLRASAVPDGLASRLSVRADAVPAVLRALGVRLSPGAVTAVDEYGPPSPPMMLPARRRIPPPPPPVAAVRVAEGPFAALVSLRR